MARETTAQGLVDEVQTFNVGEALRQQHLEMASSPNSDITVLRLARGGKTQISPQQSDQILVVLEGGCTLEGTAGAYALATDQGALVPAGVTCGIANSTEDELVLFSMRTKQRVAPVANVASAVKVKVPAEHLSGKGLGTKMYAYVMDHRTIGISPLIMEEWNQASALRMNCSFERVGDEVVATLPRRVVEWYRLAEVADDDYTIRPDRTRTRVRVDLGPYIERQARR